jgi:hypothetical protein
MSIVDMAIGVFVGMAGEFGYRRWWRRKPAAEWPIRGIQMRCHICGHGALVRTMCDGCKRSPELPHHHVRCGRYDHDGCRVKWLETMTGEK